MKLENVGYLTLIGLILAAVGIVAPISWDWYKSKSAIELHHTANVKLVETTILSKKVQVSYDGRSTPILSRHTFSIINTRRTPILKKDLVQPPTIIFPKGVELLEVIEDAKNPKDLEVEYVIGANKNTVSVTYPLLNPGDQVQFGILLSGFTSDYSAYARIVGIRKLSVIDSVEELREVRKKIPLTLYPVAFFVSIFTLVFVFAGIPELIEEIKIKSAIKNNKFIVPLGKSKGDYINFIRENFKHKSEESLKAIIKFINITPQNTTINVSEHEILTRKIMDYAMNMNIIPVVIFVFVLCTIGWWYVITRIIN